MTSKNLHREAFESFLRAVLPAPKFVWVEANGTGGYQDTHMHLLYMAYIQGRRDEKQDILKAL